MFNCVHNYASNIVHYFNVIVNFTQFILSISLFCYVLSAHLYVVCIYVVWNNIELKQERYVLVNNKMKALKYIDQSNENTTGFQISSFLLINTDKEWHIFLPTIPKKEP